MGECVICEYRWSTSSLSQKTVSFVSYSLCLLLSQVRISANSNKHIPHATYGNVGGKGYLFLDPNHLSGEKEGKKSAHS